MGYRLFIWWVRRVAGTVTLAKASTAIRVELRRRATHAMRTGRATPQQTSILQTLVGVFTL
jgi:hypothetical protein